MIKLSEIAEAGHFNKSHGIKGEISATLDINIDLDDIKCLIVPVEGIFVPFFIESWRPKTNDTCLITLDGIDSEVKAQQFVNKRFYILRSDLPDDEDDCDDEDGLYASDFIGYQVVDKTIGHIGIISDINDSTQNVLFIIKTDAGEEIYMPVADEYIVEIDNDNDTILTDLPEGLINLNT